VDPASLSGRLLALAPALWVGLLAGLILAALARWYDRVPARVVLGFAVAIALLYGEALAGGAVLLPLDNLRGHVPFLDLAPAEPHGNLLQGDLLYLIHPARREVHRAVAAGEWPLWSPRIGAGMPLLADPQSQALQPVTALGEGPLAATAGPAAVAALRTFLALVFTFLLLRHLGAGRGPAAAGALAYGLGGFLQLWIGWPLANTAALLPVVLYALVRTDREAPPGRRPHSQPNQRPDQRRNWALLVLATAGLLLAGHPETIVYALLVTGLFALDRLRRRPGHRLPWVGRLAAAFALALALASPALLPFGEILPGSVRWQRMADARSAQPADTANPAAPSRTRRADLAPGADLQRAPATRLAQALAPNSLGNSRFIHYWGLRNSNEDTAGFAGTATLLAAMMAAVLALSSLFGAGFLSFRLRGAPLRHEGLALALTAAAATLLALPAGLGLGPFRVPPGGLSGRLTLVLDLGLALSAAAGLERLRRAAPSRWLRWGAPAVMALLLVGFHLWAYSALRSPGDPAALDVLRWGWVHWHLRFGLLAAALLALGAGTRWLAPALALLIGVELVLAHGSANPPMPARLAFPSPPALAFLEHQATPGPAAAAGERMAGVGKALLPNLASVYRLSDVRVFNPLAPARYDRLLAPALARWDGEIPLLDDHDHPGLYDRLGVRWLLLPPGASCPGGTEPAFGDRSGTVCRRPDPHPLVMVDGVAPARLAQSPGGAHWTAGFYPGSGHEPDLEPAREPAEKPAASRLETGLSWSPGWRVLAEIGDDGKDAWEVAEPEPEAALLAADLPAATRRVDLLYRPAGFVGGLLLAALGLTFLLVWLVEPPR